MISRLYIRDFSYQATNEDISLLISKICPVQEVYISGITPTGINRSFAIVVVHATNEMLEKCVKTFNNCHWKGTKIYVEKANEYYKDKFDRERAFEKKQNERLIAKLLLLSDVVPRNPTIEINNDELDTTNNGYSSKNRNKNLIQDLNNLLSDNHLDAPINESTTNTTATTTSAITTVDKSIKSVIKTNIIKLKKNRDAPVLGISMTPVLASSSSGNNCCIVLFCFVVIFSFIVALDK